MALEAESSKSVPLFTVMVFNCTFEGNGASIEGGGFYSSQSILPDPLFSACNWHGNVASQFGGAISLSGTLERVSCNSPIIQYPIPLRDSDGTSVWCRAL